jgi:hypothetical protein
VDERHGVERVGDGGVVVRVGCNLGAEVGGLAVEGLVGRAGGVAILDARVGPGLTGLRPGRLRVVLASLGPTGGEARVEDAARVQRRCRRIDRRERRDRLERRGIELGREELADGAVEIPIIPTWWPSTQGWWATVSMTS